MTVKYLPYPPLQRIEFHCPNCQVTTILFSYYPQASTTSVSHICLHVSTRGRRSLRVEKMVRR